MVFPAQQAANTLKACGISCRVLDMYCIKPLDTEAVLNAARDTKAIIVIEEHVAIGGLGSMVSQVVCANQPVKVISMCLPDEPVITGKSAEVFAYYGLTDDNLVKTAMELLA
ncbi:MAG: transketolase C-terminal domain-containing protein [Marinobacter sp.]